jgi:Cu2+-exporting ATPase
VTAAGAEQPAACRHCGLPVDASVGDARFCCQGCAAAYDLITGSGLESYYRRRTLDPAQPPLRPQARDDTAGDHGDISQAHAREVGDGECEVRLMVEGLHCAACVWLIESVLAREEGVRTARVNMTTRRLRLRWRADAASLDDLVRSVERLGYRLVPFDPDLIDRAAVARDRELLRAMAVAGFAFGNVMLLSVSVWSGHAGGMGPATRDLFHWLSALIAMPVVVYAGRPFFRSAWAALRNRRTNMDVPISVGVLLATAMSLWGTVRGLEHVYFDSAVGLLFFLLLGRYLDGRVRGRAHRAAQQILALQDGPATVLDDDGRPRPVRARDIATGMRVYVVAGQRIPVDGRIIAGESDVDTGLIDGEAVPKAVAPGREVFAGTVNLTAPLTVSVTAVGERTLLAEIARLIEVAENQKTRHVALADRVARLYTPVVHLAALATFLGWWLAAGVAWPDALFIAIAVLIITCPCALALAVPVVQVVAVNRLLRQGILVKSGTALERLADIDKVVFDKTGTLTEGQPRWRPDLVDVGDAGDASAAALSAAADLAASSRHPLARALSAAARDAGLSPVPPAGAREVAGRGMECDGAEGTVRLGSRSFCGVADDDAQAGMELWFARPPAPPVRFAFDDPLRADSGSVIGTLRAGGYGVALLSGDRAPSVAAAAVALGITDWRAPVSPAGKVAALTAMAGQGHAVLMVGDGLNDAPALAAARASMSPSTAMDISQSAADVVFQGSRLAPVLETLRVAKRARRLVLGNLALSCLYNAIALPVAAAGYVTPLVAAVAMSVSSLAVTLNALRLGRTPGLAP